MEFDLLPLTWDAVATFLTGFAAVGGAVFVGRRQLQITDLQTKIQQQQAEDDRKIRQNELRFKLLEKRQNCIRKIQRANGIFNANLNLDDEEKKELFHAIRESELIFPPDTISKLRETLTNVHRIPIAYRMQGRKRQQDKTKEADEDLDRALALEQDVFEALPEIEQSMISLTRIEDWD